ncbi:MAG: DUF1574 family protein [Coleofasciculaceae cyanobacterium]
MLKPGVQLLKAHSNSSVISPGKRFVMLDALQRTQKDRPSSLAQWAYDAIGQPEVSLRVRLRGNNLHILCESRQEVAAPGVVSRLIEALKADSGKTFPIDPNNPIYQIVIYGRIVGEERPDWIKQIRIKSLVNEEQGTSEGSALQETTEPNLLISHQNLASSGTPEAIARYLSETLSPMGVNVKVLIQTLGSKTNGTEASQPTVNQRLWVICNSNYSPDPSLLATPVVERLRSLQLKGFINAAICSQVRGEAKPEWMLRVDLTPPEEMLREWARWGDIEAIARLLNTALTKSKLEVRAVLKDVTLHVFCNTLIKETTPEKPTAVKTISRVLELLAPQGIQAATIYGVEPDHHLKKLANPEPETPLWVEWLNLPAAQNPVLADSTHSLAQKGHQEAITFLLQRLLNPDLDQRLATGGIQLKIRRKQDLLHIMSEAPVCPSQAQVGAPLARYLKQLKIPNLAGVRVYGRRAGSTAPAWNYGVDFVQRQRLVPEATPEFAANDAYINELVAPTGEAVLRPDLTKEDLQKGLHHAKTVAVAKLGRYLCYSQLFVPMGAQDMAAVRWTSEAKNFRSAQGLKVALVWGTLGLLLTWQTDWLLGRMLRWQTQANSTLPAAQVSPTPLPLPQLSLQKAGSEAENFNASGFTRDGERVIIDGKEDKPTIARRVGGATAAIAAKRSSTLAFNNQLLDDKLALYQQRIKQVGPPDVLVLGSSRALRGVDPQALQTALAAQGFANVEVFNFGINGATAQVVDLIIRRILTPDQLPKLVIWADGARAFNSGRVDATYNAIASSPGYQAIKANTDVNSSEEASSSSTGIPPLDYFETKSQSLTKWLNQSLANVSSTYSQKDQLKSLLRENFVTSLEKVNISANPITESEKLLTAEEPIDFDGFLPLTVRYNPATYYKKHPKVTGDYDNDYESFQLDGKQDSALNSLLKYAKIQNVGIVFVNLPLTKNYLDPVRKEYEAKFQQYMRTSAVQKGLVFRDLSQMLLTKHDYFSDPSHLNRYGAYQVSNKLAQDSMINWPTK